MPTQVGIYGFVRSKQGKSWMPTCVGMTRGGAGAFVPLW
jgi:hypothetical protein